MVRFCQTSTVLVTSLEVLRIRIRIRIPRIRVFLAVLRIRIRIHRIHMFLGLSDPDPSIIMQK